MLKYLDGIFETTTFVVDEKGNFFSLLIMIIDNII